MTLKKPPTGAESSASDELRNLAEEVDAAIDALARARASQSIPEIHVHVDAPRKESKAPASAPSTQWVKVAAAIGLPALLLEIVRRVLQ
jgi:hypothetical protein